MKPIICLDNDRCIGNWEDLSLLYSYYTQVLDSKPSLQFFAELMDKTFCARPGLRYLYKTLLSMRKRGSISSIWMVTAAKNGAIGWVSFLKKLLEFWFGEKIYDGMVDGDDLIKWNEEKRNPITDYAIWKDMNQVRYLSGAPDDTSVIIIDDNIRYILNGKKIEVKPYIVAINLIVVARTLIDEWTSEQESLYGQLFEKSWVTYKNNPHIYSSSKLDKELYFATSSLSSTLFPSVCTKIRRRKVAFL